MCAFAVEPKKTASAPSGIERDLGRELRRARRGDDEREPEQRGRADDRARASAGRDAAATSAPITVPMPSSAMRKPGETGAAVERVAAPSA